MLLEDLQRSMIAAIDHGPAYVDADAFLGGRAAALRGLAVHANTISHARLVAIEETFPRTRKRMGEAQFNALSREYIEMPGVATEVHSSIGRLFPGFLGKASHTDAAALAAFEWAWLNSYHADEAEALALAGLAGLGEDELLQTRVALHPATRLAGPVHDGALERDHPGLAEAAGVLVTRPGAEVLVAPASVAMVRQFANLAKPQPVCNLLECGSEPAGEDSLQALFSMLEAGSLVLA